jgi:hypothetical protein
MLSPPSKAFRTVLEGFLVPWPASNYYNNQLILNDKIVTRNIYTDNYTNNFCC